MYDLVVRNGVVIDGSGGPRFVADVAIAGDRIVRVGRLEGEAAREIEARGLCLAPGFIDPHTHSELTLLADSRAESKVRQGVTTEVVGNCGFSPAPLVGEALEDLRRDASMLGLEIDWRTMAGYFDRLERQGVAVNVLSLVGHNTVRGCVLGYADVQPRVEQQAAMERLAAQAAEAGATGVSGGLFYPPGSYASWEEVAGVAAAGGTIYASHIRDENRDVCAAVEEAIRIGERSDVAVQVSHVKLSGQSSWPKLDELLETVDASLGRNVPIGFDQYPYTASGTWLIAMLPYWAQEGGAAGAAALLRDPEVRARLREDRRRDPAGWEQRSGVSDWDAIVIGSCPGDEDAGGHSIADLAAARRCDPLELSFELIVASGGAVDATWHDQSDAVVEALLRHPRVAVGSDGEAVAPDGPTAVLAEHPRSYGTFPRVLGRYVRDRRVLTLEEAVRKMTSLTASQFGIRHRGVVREGGFADLVLFDPDSVADTATYADPAQFPAGIVAVVVNGQIVLQDGRRTGALPGRVLRRR